MAKIPVSKYPNQAGYMQFDTNNNRVEVFSDGKFGPVGAVPFDHDIDIYVGPGGDFDNPDDALDYIQYLQPKHFRFKNFLRDESRSIVLYKNPQINLIFKTGYVFENPFVLENKFMPWLNITQEDLNIPLSVTLLNQPSDPQYPVNAVTIYNSHIRSFSLNLLNQATHLDQVNVEGIVVGQGSVVQRVPYIKAEHFSIGLISQTGAHVNRVIEYHMNDMFYYGFYSASPGSIIFFINDRDIMYPSSMTNIGLAAFCTMENGHLHLYRGDHTIDKCHHAFRCAQNGTIFIHSDTTINVSNLATIIRIDQSGMFDTYSPITKGNNIRHDIYPTDLTVNTFDPRGWVRADPSLTKQA